ncbi:GDP-mannose 4,6-dehydratase [Candidatus Beckwithbacteria bacterium]|nr:GDP-mannose 4,6-dehydratase [Candidatus Beckwithbacteria bacterium]
MKTALITGITGQDGSYLSEFLLERDYQVVGMVSGKNDIGGQNITHIKDKLILEEGDLLDKASIENLIRKYQFDEVYNLGGISFVPVSWDKPVLNYDVNGLGVLRILEAIRDFSPQTRFFQATSARIFGQSDEEKQSEKTAYNPPDPYSVAKLCAHLSCQLFRQHFDTFACSGILYNHESPRRGSEFVTRKITQGAVKIKLGLEKQLALGNLEAKQDWGYALDYVQAMWLMLQQDKADDYILATGELHTVKDIVTIAFGKLGLNWEEFVTMAPEFYRETPKKNYYGNPEKAEKTLGWKRSLNFQKMIEMMVDYDMQLLNKQ